MRALKICLWIAGILCLLSVVGLFLPFSVFESIADYFGVEELPAWPLFIYAIRTGAAAFVGIGIFFIIIALDPMKYGVLVPFSGITAVFIGAVCAISGPIVGMPAIWYLGDALSCLALGVLILVFWRRAK
ncbi:MAG: hypothetical protein ACYTEQ_27770 [Planctomycetota bacterium]|jgi:hypothetical protein